jgi:hypothetical protein
MRPVKRIAKILALAAAHFVVALIAFSVAFSSGMHRFDHGGEPTFIEIFSDTAVNVLWFPFLTLARLTGIHGGGPAEWLLLSANSILWGTVLYFFLTALWRRFTRSSPSSAA